VTEEAVMAEKDSGLEDEKPPVTEDENGEHDENDEQENQPKTSPRQKRRSRSTCKCQRFNNM